MDFSIITDNVDLILSGLWVTVWTVALSLFLGFFVAIIFALMATSRYFIPRIISDTYSYIFRGTPMLIQLYILYYGFGIYLGNINGIRETFWWSIIVAASPWAVLSMVLNTGAYTCEIFKGAIKNTPQGEIEAAKAMGFSRLKMMQRIVLPSALRRAIPAYGNEVIYVLQGSAIFSYITVMDLTGVARKLRDDYYDPYTPFITVALIYLVITLTIVGLFKLIEKRYLSHLANN